MARHTHPCYQQYSQQFHPIRRRLFQGACPANPLRPSPADGRSRVRELPDGCPRHRCCASPACLHGRQCLCPASARCFRFRRPRRPRRWFGSWCSAPNLQTRSRTKRARRRGWGKGGRAEAHGSFVLCASYKLYYKGAVQATSPMRTHGRRKQAFCLFSCPMEYRDKEEGTTAAETTQRNGDGKKSLFLGNRPPGGT